jgi:hypothetical protein
MSDDDSGSPAPLAQPAPPSTAPTVQDILSQYDKLTYENRAERQDRLDADKGTATAYDRHLETYEEFWSDFQDQEQLKKPFQPRIPAYPINTTKVILFLEYEITRPKVCCLQTANSVLTIMVETAQWRGHPKYHCWLSKHLASHQCPGACSVTERAQTRIPSRPFLSEKATVRQ